MNKFNFDIYIGNKMIKGQADNVAAFIIPKFYLPKGKCNLCGISLQNNEEVCFNRIYDVGTYIADWIDLLGDANLIHATIFLNILSLHKSFKGKEIIEYIDKIDKASNRFEIRSFNDLN